MTGTEITIQDPIPVTLSFTDGSPSPTAITSLREEGGTQTVRVKAAVDTAPAADLTVNITTGGGSALPGAGNDYVSSANSAQVIIKAGETSGLSPALTITVADDTATEGGETIRFTGTVAEAGYGVRGADLTITDNDDNIVLSVSPDTIVERSTANLITVTATFAGAASSALAADTEVTVSVAGAAGAEGAVAGPGADFTTDQTGAFTVVIPAAQISGTQTFQLTARDDHDDAEGDEKVAVSGSALVGGAAAVTGTEITIQDPIPVTLSFTDGSPSPTAITSLREEGGTQTVRVKAAVDTAPAADLTVNITTGGGSALPGAGNDYVSSANSAQVIIKAGETSGLSPALTITVADDTATEGGETIRFTAAASASGDRISSAYLTINDNDDDIVLSVNPNAVVERPSANLISVTAAFAGAASSDLAADTEVTVNVAGGSGEDGAAMGADGDFTTDIDGGAFTVIIPGGQLSGSGLFRLTAPPDDDSEGAEKAGVSGAASVGGRAVAVTGDEVSIVDTGVRLSVTNPSDGSAVTAVNEAGAARTVRVTAVLPSGTTAGEGGVTVPFELASGSAVLDSDGSAFGTREDFQVGYPGSDPVEDDGFASGIAIASGNSSHYMDITLAVNDDAVAEGSETILLRGGEVTVSDTAYAVADSQLEIIDDDPTPTVINLTLLSASDADLAGVAENSGTTKVRVRASFAGGKSLPWEVTVPIQVGVQGRTGFSARYNPCNPPQNLIEVSLGGGGTLAITGDTATPGSDYAAITGLSVTIPAYSATGIAEFDLAVTDDSQREGTESLTVDGDPEGTLNRFTVNDDALLIYDDEQPLSAVDITLLDSADRPISQVSEGSAASVTVQLSYPGEVTLDEERTVWVVVEEVTAKYRVDYDIYCVIKRALTIPANQQRVEDSFGLITSGVPYDDNVVEGDETLRVTGELAGYGFTPRILTIKDDDVRPSRIELNVSPATVAEKVGEEAQSMTVTAKFPDNSAVLTSDTVVEVTIGGDARSGEDYKDLSVESPFSITIPAGSRQGQQKMTVAIVDDVVYEEDNKQISFTGSASGFTVEGASLTITDDDPAPPNAPDYPPGANPPDDPPGTNPPDDPEPPETNPPDELPGANPPDDPPDSNPPDDPEPPETNPPDDPPDSNPPDDPEPPETNPPVAPKEPTVNNPPPPAPQPPSPPPPVVVNDGVPDPPVPAPFIPPQPPPEQPACRGRFCDEDDSIHAANIEQIAEWRITLGCDAGDPTMFCPSGLITRRQMAAFLYRAASLRSSAPASQEVTITDVPADAWYRPFADWAVSVGSFTAPRGVFDPSGVVTRADMAVMMTAAFPHIAEKEEPDGLFADTDHLDPATVRAIEAMYEAGVTRGCAAAPLSYCPDQPVTRAQMASFFVRAINLAPAEADL